MTRRRSKVAVEKNLTEFDHQNTPGDKARISFLRQNETRGFFKDLACYLIPNQYLITK